MTVEKITLKDFIDGKPILEKKKKKLQKKRKTGGLVDSWFTAGTPGVGSGISAAGSSTSTGIGESLLSELFAGITPSAFSANINSATAFSKNSNDKNAGMTTYPSENPGANPWAWEEEPELKVNKVDQARQLFQALYNRPNATRADIINSFMKDVGVTNSTAVSYYTRFLDEFGLSSKEGGDSLGQGTGMGMGGTVQQQPAGNETRSAPVEEQPQMEEPINPNMAGIIRTVDNAHLVYKRQSADGTYEELWIYNMHDSTNDELNIRRDILAGTDIPPKKTKSADGAEKYVTRTMGNAQMLYITGLPN